MQTVQMFLKKSNAFTFLPTAHPEFRLAAKLFRPLLDKCWCYVQGLGAPACAKLLTQWYSSSERGTAWSIWTASNNVGGFAAPFIAGTAAGMFGWRWGMWVPALVAVSVASIIMFTITDKPAAAGFNAVETVKKDSKAPSSAAEDTDKGPSVKEILMQDVLPNPWVWLFAITYFFVYAVRQGTSSWFVHYLMNVKGISDLPAAAAQVSGLEVGGFFGALSAGKHPVRRDV